MIQIRNGIFETNSSSVHSLVFISDEQMCKFRAGELLFDKWKDKLITPEEAGNIDNDFRKHIYDKDDLWEIGCHYGGESFARTEYLPDGGHVNYICYYGHD